LISSIEVSNKPERAELDLRRTGKLRHSRELHPRRVDSRSLLQAPVNSR